MDAATRSRIETRIQWVEDEMEAVLKPTGFFRAKTNSLINLGAALTERYGGEVPGRLEDLVTLPGVGRKTANLVLILLEGSYILFISACG